MMPSPDVYVIHKCAVSIDGFIDDSSRERLRLSNEEDFDRLDEVRASCDAILVGAGTVRADNPRLQIRSEDRQRARVARNQAPHPLRVTITRSGKLASDAHFFLPTGIPPLVYCPRSGGVAAKLRGVLGGRAVIVPQGDSEVALRFVLDDLAARGVRRLLVEGGSLLGTQLLAEGLIDELQFSIAPFFVGEKDAPRFVLPAVFPHDKRRPMQLREVQKLGHVALLVFQLRGGGVDHADGSRPG